MAQGGGLDNTPDDDQVCPPDRRLPPEKVAAFEVDSEGVGKEDISPKDTDGCVNCGHGGQVAGG